MQASHARSLHTNGCVQQQEAVALESEPSPLPVFRAQENDPVSMSDFICQYVVTSVQAKVSRFSFSLDSVCSLHLVADAV